MDTAWDAQSLEPGLTSNKAGGKLAWLDAALVRCPLSGSRRSATAAMKAESTFVDQVTIQNRRMENRPTAITSGT